MFSIYAIKNLKNNKCYVGQTSRDIKIRWEQHLSQSKSTDTYLYRALNKYGIESFTSPIVLETCDSKEESNIREKFWILSLKTNDSSFGYNSTNGGEGCSGYKHTEQFKDKISKCNRNRVWSEVSKIKLSESIKKLPKRTLSTEHRGKISEANRRRIVTEETKRKISIASKERANRPETKDKFKQIMKEYYDTNNS